MLWCIFCSFSTLFRIRYLLLARMLRLFRLLMHVQRYRAFLATFLSLVPSLMPYLGTIFCVMCIYCSLGVQVCSAPPFALLSGFLCEDVDGLPWLLPITNCHVFLWRLFKLKIQHGGHCYSPSFNILSCPKFLLHFQLSFHLVDWWSVSRPISLMSALWTAQCISMIDEDFSLLLYQSLVQGVQCITLIFSTFFCADLWWSSLCREP